MQNNILNSSFADFSFYQVPDLEPPNLLGENGKHIGIVLHEEDYTAYSDLLDKITSAIGVNINSDALMILVKNKQPLNIAQIATKHELKHLLVFGFRPKNIGFQTPFTANKYYETENFGILLTFSLSNLNSSNDYKRSLWNALKLSFNNI